MRWLLALLLVLAATPASAGLLDGGRNWDLLTVPNRKAIDVRFPEPDRLIVDAHAAVGFLYRRVSAPQRVLKWRWRVDTPMSAFDQFRKNVDDRPIAIHLWFDRPRGGPALFGGVARLFGYPRITYALTYVWGGRQPVGTVGANPYFDGGKIMILRSGNAPTAHWLSENRDVEADLMRAFDGAVTLADLTYIAVSADTDDHGDDSRAQVADLHWSAN